jgi:Rrf2 family protein
MQLTRAADYAVRVMVHLAGVPAGDRVTRMALAEQGDVPEAFLSKVLQSLTRAGLIVSHRGASGGYSLGGAGGAITLLEVVEALEGPIQLNVCVGPHSNCNRSVWCPVHPVWERAQEALTSVLRSVTIASLAAESPAANPDFGVM